MIKGNADRGAWFRVKDNRPDALKQALDHGANGVVVPLIESIDDARRAVAGCKYPPQGVRGYGPFMHSYGWNDREYHSTANEETVVFVQVEHYRAVDVIEEIAELARRRRLLHRPQRFDAFDGHLWQAWDSEEFISTIQRILRAGDANGIPVGFPVDVLGGAASGIAWVKQYAPTMRLLAIGGDLGFVSTGAEAALNQLSA